MLTFQKLDVYRCSVEFLVLCRHVRGALGRGNAELADQMRRAAQSISQNIAEGVGKVTRADKARFFAIARGSAMESAAHLDVMLAEELIASSHHQEGIRLLEPIVSMLTKLMDA